MQENKQSIWDKEGWNRMSWEGRELYEEYLQSKKFPREKNRSNRRTDIHFYADSIALGKGLVIDTSQFLTSGETKNSSRKEM